MVHPFSIFFTTIIFGVAPTLAWPMDPNDPISTGETRAGNPGPVAPSPRQRGDPGNHDPSSYTLFPSDDRNRGAFGNRNVVQAASGGGHEAGGEPTVHHDVSEVGNDSRQSYFEKPPYQSGGSSLVRSPNPWRRGGRSRGGGAGRSGSESASWRSGSGCSGSGESGSGKSGSESDSWRSGDRKKDPGCTVYPWRDLDQRNAAMKQRERETSSPDSSRRSGGRKPNSLWFTDGIWTEPHKSEGFKPTGAKPGGSKPGDSKPGGRW